MYILFYMNDAHAHAVDPTLVLEETSTPGGGVSGQMSIGPKSGWGGLSENETKSQSHQLDTSIKDVSLIAPEEADYTAAKDYVLSTGKASTSSLQTAFRWGYNKAATIMDQLEKAGIIGPVQSGERYREVNKIPAPEVKATPVTIDDRTEGEKKLAEFYETPTELLTFEERALVNPRELAAKLLSRVEYYPSAGLQMVEFFLAKAKYRITMDTHYRKDGEMREFERHIPNSPPMFSEFGRTIGVSERTLKAWAKKEPAFQEAFEICQDIIQEFFVENGVKGDYSAAFAIFAAKNLTKMKDVVVNKNEVYDMKGILDQLEKGRRPSD